MSVIPAGFVACTVGTHHGSYLVTFGDDRTLLLQDDCDSAAFAVRCGAIRAPQWWDGQPSTLPGWAECDLALIESCPDEYLDVAERE